MELMKEIPDGSVDMILCDLPYGVLNNSDDKINLKGLWTHYKRLIQRRGIIVLTAVQPFTSELVMNDIDMFKYELIWKKTKASGFINANRRPLNEHESILIFYNRLPIYNPQKVYVGIKDRRKTFNKKLSNQAFTNDFYRIVRKDDGWRFPTSVQEFFNSDKTKRLHPSEKPVKMFEWLINTYTNEGCLVLDNCIGSGTTAVAARQTGRNFIGIELNSDYVNIANKRLNQKNLTILDQNE